MTVTETENYGKILDINGSIINTITRQHWQDLSTPDKAQWNATNRTISEHELRSMTTPIG